MESVTCNIENFVDGSGENIRESKKEVSVSFHHEVIVDDIIFATLGCGMGSEV